MITYLQTFARRIWTSMDISLKKDTTPKTHQLANNLPLNMVPMEGMIMTLKTPWTTRWLSRITVWKKRYSKRTHTCLSSKGTLHAFSNQRIFTAPIMKSTIRKFSSQKKKRQKLKDVKNKWTIKRGERWPTRSRLWGSKCASNWQLPTIKQLWGRSIQKLRSKGASSKVTRKKGSLSMIANLK